jgi:hypothetical protein
VNLNIFQLVDTHGLIRQNLTFAIRDDPPLGLHRSVSAHPPSRDPGCSETTLLTSARPSTFAFLSALLSVSNFGWGLTRLPRRVSKKRIGLKE